MQTFLPYPDFEKSLAALDYRRLGKQRVEAMQLIRSIDGTSQSKGWSNHPAKHMWKNNLLALKHYHNLAITEWKRRGYNNNMVLYDIDGDIEYPRWFGNEAFHAAHRSNLLRKNKEYYKQFGWDESDDLPYIWPI
jgi:hypothetical protein